MIQRTKVAIDKDITLTTLLWYQGENDGIDKTLGVSFGHNWPQFYKMYAHICNAMIFQSFG
jgi:hypothetical protein